MVSLRSARGRSSLAPDHPVERVHEYPQGGEVGVNHCSHHFFVIITHLLIMVTSMSHPYVLRTQTPFKQTFQPFNNTCSHVTPAFLQPSRSIRMNSAHR